MAGTTDDLKQLSPNFLAPGTGFVEDNLSEDGVGGDGFRMIQAHYFFFFKLKDNCFAML